MRALRGAIVGFGFIAERGHLPAYRGRRTDARSFEIVAVADTCPARREQAQRAIPGVRVYESHLSLLAAERARLDFIDVATPPRAHASVAIAALDCGLHVLCEKPLSTTAEDAHKMIARARAQGRVLFPCHNYKHAPVIKTVDRLLDAGAIGRVHLVTLDTFRNTHARGVAEWRPDWRRDRRMAGGGIAMDHGSHTFYLAASWLRSSATSITAKMSASGTHDTEDNFACTITFPAGVATARLTWNAGVRKVIYTLHGDHGAIRIEDDDVEVTIREGVDSSAPVRTTRERVGSDWMDASHASWFQSMQDQFAEAIAAGDCVGKEALEALRCVELIACAYASARAGCREIELPQEDTLGAPGLPSAECAS